jgi:hypothetical protein
LELVNVIALMVVMNDDILDNDELIFRSVPCNSRSVVESYKISDGRLRIGSQAFRDREKKPSVDRAKLCNNDPTYTQFDESDGVISLVTGDVRQIKGITYTLQSGSGNNIIEYDIDVIYRPISDNPAHAQIEPSPEFLKSSTFKKLQERLALLASNSGWLIPPEDLRE